MENAPFQINAHVHLDGMVQHVIQVGVSLNRQNENKNFVIHLKRNDNSSYPLLLYMFKLFVVKVVSKVKGNVFNQIFASVLMAGLENPVINQPNQHPKYYPHPQPKLQPQPQQQPQPQPQFQPQPHVHLDGVVQHVI